PARWRGRRGVGFGAPSSTEVFRADVRAVRRGRPFSFGEASGSFGEASGSFGEASGSFGEASGSFGEAPPGGDHDLCNRAFPAHRFAAPR
ncbi:MAG: hypothetical protein SGJ21_07120, partial [Alphaproteobacteria bacterium]|nr:hypothetical protein [Alphaproteobacteria bacterium]